MRERHTTTLWMDAETRGIRAIPIVPSRFEHNPTQLKNMVRAHMQRSGAGIIIFERLPIEGIPTHDTTLGPTYRKITPYDIEEIKQLTPQGRARVFKKIIDEIKVSAKTLLIDLPI